MALRDIPDDWQHADIELAAAFSERKKLAIDCGAHRGVVTKKLLEIFDEVVAIEPSDLADQIKGARVVKRALGSRPGYVALAPGKTNTGQQHCVEGFDIEVITLDSLDLAPDFIKMDVEGMEYFAILGAEQTIKKHRPVIMFEENGLNRRYGVRDGEVGQLLESWGFERVAVVSSNPPDEDWIYKWPN